MNTMVDPNSITPAPLDITSSTKLESRKANGACIAADTVVKGSISNCKHIAVYGVVEGELDVGHVIIHQNGLIDGKITAASAEIHGKFEGDISVSGLLHLSSSGSITGSVHYSEILVENGAVLSADLRKKKAK